MTRFVFASAGKGLVGLMVLELALLASVYLLVFFVMEAREISDPAILPGLLSYLLITVVGLYATGLYNPRLRCDGSGILHRFIISFIISSLLLYLVQWLGNGVFPAYRPVLVVLLLSYMGLCLCRYLLSWYLDAHFRYRVLVLGSGEQAAIIAKRMRRDADRKAFELMGYVSIEPERPILVPEEQLLRLDEPLERYVEREGVDEVVVACDERRNLLPVKALFECRIRGVSVVDILDFIERETGQVAVNMMYPSWIIYSSGFRRPHSLRAMADYLLNFIIAALLLAVTLPLMLLVALAIVVEDRGPVLFSQIRIGQRGQPFRIYKFRSMRSDSERAGAKWAAQDDDRTTRVGRVIRKYHIDELPQIFNVLKGEMSFIGPRPEQPAFVKKLAEAIPYYNERHQVKPGLTGWAQLRYPYGASENDALEKLKYDLYYIKNKSLLFDLMIIIQTIEVVVFAKGSR